MLYGYYLNYDEVEVDCALLNEQQATLNKQLDQIIELQDKYRILEFNHSRLEKRNKAQYEKIGEQQAIINKVYELLEEADIFSDEATEHDINAYIELQEFDNKDAYYLACDIKKAIKLLKGDIV